MTNKTPKQPNYVINPKAKIAGKTQTQLADGWWKYANSIPQEDNPALERTGDFSGANQSGDVYYLSGVFNDPSGVDINRKIVVPEGKILFVPIIGAVTLGNNIVEPPPFSDTSESNLKDMKKQNDNIEVLNLTIDGKPVLNLSQAPNYRQQTVDPNGFSFNTPENGTFTDTPYNNAFLSKSYADGYYVGINALPVGKHTISFQAKTPKVSGDYGENIQNITYTIDVKPFNKDINGDEKNNTLKGNWKNDNIDAFGGDDTVYGYGGDDIIDGGAGKDKLYGGDGNDIVYGGAGNDLLDGDCGDDVLAGGLGNDKIYGGDGNDRLYGGSGSDEIYGGNGHDKIYGGDGNDKIEGGNGNDVIDAVAYSALVLPYRYAPDFSDKFINFGQNQIDKIKGGAGSDIFVLGDRAINLPPGKTGSAYYVGDKDADYALIQDFKLGTNGDKIQLFSQTINPSDYVLGAVTAGLPNGVGIYTSDTHDLIGIVQGDNVSLATLNLTNSSQFNLVG